MNTFCHNIGNIIIRLLADIDLPQLRTIPFDLFLTNQKKIDINVVIKKEKIENLHPLSEEYCDNLSLKLKIPRRWLSTDICYTNEIRLLLEDFSKIPDNVNVEFAWNRAIFRNYLTSSLTLIYPSEIIDKFYNVDFIAGYRNMIAGFFPTFDSLLLHGSGVILNNKSAVFFAPDEGGKTTLVNAFINTYQNGVILSDDQILLKKESDNISVFSTPLGKSTSGPASAPIGAYFFLHKAKTFIIKPKKLKDLFLFLWKDNQLQMNYLPIAFRKYVFDLLLYSLKQAPIFDLYVPCNITLTDWLALESVIS